MPRIGPHSRPDKLQIADGRLAEAKLMARAQHLGGKPSATQRILIDRAAAPSLRIHLMDRESARSGGMSERNGRQYQAWSNSLTRVLNQIGFKAVAAKPLPSKTTWPPVPPKHRPRHDRTPKHLQPGDC